MNVFIGILLLVVAVAAFVSAAEAESVVSTIGIGAVGTFAATVSLPFLLHRWPAVLSVLGRWLGWLPGAAWYAIGATLLIEWDALGVGGRRINEPSDSPGYAILSLLIGTFCLGFWLWILRTSRPEAGSTRVVGPRVPPDLPRQKRRARRRRSRSR